MKTFFYYTGIFIISGILTILNAQTQHKIALQLFVQAKDSGAVSVYADTIKEGQIYTLDPKTLPSNYAGAQPLYNALVGSEFYFEQGSLNENISIWFVISNVDLSKGDYYSESGVNLFFNAQFAVYDSNGNLQPEPFNLNPGKYAIIKVFKNKAFNNFIDSTGINLADSLAFAYETATGFDATGIKTFDSTSSITAEISHFSHVVGLTKNSITGVKESSYAKNIPSNFELKQNYPNPFNPSTTIEYALPAKSFVQLNVYNVLGIKIATLVNKEINAGMHSVEFSPQNLSSGLYIYELKTNKATISRKMLYLK